MFTTSMCTVMVEALPSAACADKAVERCEQQQSVSACAPDAQDAAAQDADAAVDVSSVVTQYFGPTTHQGAVADAQAKWQQLAAADAQQPGALVLQQQPSRDSSSGGSTSSNSSTASSATAGSSSWRHRLRHLLCCVAPPPPLTVATAPGLPGSPTSLQLSALYAAQAGALGGAVPVPPPRCREGPPVIGPQHPDDAGKKTLVLDLDETLVHSSFKPIPNPDYIIPVEIEGRLVDVYVLKRPWLDHFLAMVCARFEVVVFTASLAKYADPLLDLMDKSGLVRWRLFRESCCPYEGYYVKDLTCLGRDLAHTIIVDNSPHSYVFQPENAVPISTFIDDMADQELLEVLPQLLQVEGVQDVRHHLGASAARSKALCATLR